MQRSTGGCNSISSKQEQRAAQRGRHSSRYQRWSAGQGASRARRVSWNPSVRRRPRLAMRPAAMSHPWTGWLRLAACHFRYRQPVAAGSTAFASDAAVAVALPSEPGRRSLARQGQTLRTTTPSHLPRRWQGGFAGMRGRSTQKGAARQTRAAPSLLPRPLQLHPRLPHLLHSLRPPPQQLPPQRHRLHLPPRLQLRRPPLQRLHRRPPL